MADPKRLSIADIDASGRVRVVDEAHAQAIAASISVVGLIQRIAVRHTPNGQRRWKLVIGAHRLRALEIVGRTELVEGSDFDIQNLSGGEALLIELEENAKRNDLTTLERALAVNAYKQAWESVRGEIKRGGDQPARWAVWSERRAILDGVGEHVAAFSDYAAERLGVAKRTAERLKTIADSLVDELAMRLHGTRYANSQTALLGLSRLVPAYKLAIAAYEGDLDDIIREALHGENHAQVQPENKRHSAVVSNLRAMGERARRGTFLDIFRAHPDDVRWALKELGEIPAKPRERLPKLSELIAEADAQAGGGGASLPPPHRYTYSK